MSTTYPDLMPLGGRRPLRLYLRDVWERREFATSIAVGEVRSQHMDTVLGNLWHVLNPLLLIGVYYLVFGGPLLDVSRGATNYIAFLAIGVFSYHYSQKSIMAGTKAIITNEGLIRSIQFPRLVLPLSTVIGQTIAYLPSVAVMLFIALVTGERLAWTWLLLIPVGAVQLLFNIGGACVAARLTNHFRDTQNVLPYLFRLGFYLSGVLYPVMERFGNSPTLLALFEYNPFYGFVTLARQAVMEGTASVALIRNVLIWTVTLFIGGVLFFRAGEQDYGRG